MKDKYIIASLVIISTVITMSIVVAQNEINNSKPYIDPAIYNAFNESEWVRVIIRLKDDYNMSAIDEILSILNENEFKLIRRFSDGFAGPITKEGFNKLVSDPRIKFINLDLVGSVSLDDSIPLINNSVTYVDPALEEAFVESEWVRVIVRLKDNSGINITGTLEERRELLRQKDEWFKLVIDGFLSTLNETEFINAGKLSDGFGGSITKEGFDSLINNEKIREIHLDRVGHTTVENTTKENNSVLNQGKIKSERLTKLLQIMLIVGFIILVMLIIILTKRK